MDYSSTSSSSSSSKQFEIYSATKHMSGNGFVTHKRNAGRKKFKETRHPIYRGVRQRNGPKWVCEVREPNKKSRLWLGTYSTPEMAARAYDVAALALRGKSAPLNFPDSAWMLPRPNSSSPEDIKATAFRAAQEFGRRPPPPSSPTSSTSSSSSSCSSVSATSDKYSRERRIIEDVPEPSMVFWDEEATFNLPHLLDSMAEGLLLSPPTMQTTFDWDDVCWNGDISLWSN
ncbi:hypothetical protein ACHQM5_010185 [Ranunculus cassubicifolius]